MRGDTLRLHILYAAKNVFLKEGFERASMDLIAARAQTSKRTLYAHFESKENLFAAVLELATDMYRARIKGPSEYSAEPHEALTLFCARTLEFFLYTWTVRMCRLSISEAERFPQAAASYFDGIFAVTHARLAEYLGPTFHLTPKKRAGAATLLLGRLVYPAFPRALFGLEELYDEIGETLREDFDLKAVRNIVNEFIDSLA